MAAEASTDRTVRIGLIQVRDQGSAEANLAYTLDRIRQAAAGGAQIICTQELFTTSYFCRTQDPALFDLAESVPGPTTDALATLAAELGVVIIGSLFERRAAGVYHNTAAVIDADGSYLGKYRKMHIPDDPLFLEKFYFTPGDLGFKVFETSGIKVGVLICWDQWFPEGARMTALKGAQVLVYPTAIGWHPSEKETHGDAQLSAWQTIQRSHAVANGVYVVAVNRTGFEPTNEDEGYPDGIQFWGNSFIAGPDGVPVASAEEKDEGHIMTDFNVKDIADQRHGWPFLRDRRVDAYDGLNKKYLDED